MSIRLGMGVDVGNASMRCKGVRGQGFRIVSLRCELAQGGARGFRVALLRCELAQDGARGFGMGNGAWGWFR